MNQIVHLLHNPVIEIKKSLNEFWKNIPDEWKQTIVPDNQDVLSNNWTPTL